MPRPKAFNETEVLEKAMYLFWKKGYHHTTMQDLVDSMGINRASMYDTYGDKHQLYLACLNLYKNISTKIINNAIASEKSPIAQIRSLLNALATEAITDIENKCCFFANAALEMLPHDIQVNKIIIGNTKDINKLIEALIINAQQKGLINTNKSSTELAFFIQSNMYGIRVIAKNNPKPEQLYNLVDQVMEAL
jgi:TetR/AcrR family transcriptional regulator, transcriptional repressor for nem operon